MPGGRASTARSARRRLISLALSGEGGSAGWSEDPLPVASLRSFDAALDLDLDNATLGTLTLGKSAMRLVLQDGEIEGTFDRLGLFDGSVGGKFTADVRGTPSFSADLTGSDLATEQIGAQLIGSDRLRSTADGTISVTGRGASVAAIMDSLNGKGDLTLGPGQLNGIDIAAMLRQLDPTAQAGSNRTLLDSATASFTITNGMLDNPDLAVLAPIMVGSGKGSIGLGPRNLDYTFIAEIPSTIVGKPVSLPIHISGSWSNPKFGFDMQDLIQARFGVNLDGLGADATDALRKRVSDELGIDLKPGQDIKQALTEGLQAKAIDAFSQGLLGKPAITEDHMAADQVRAEGRRQGQGGGCNPDRTRDPDSRRARTRRACLRRAPAQCDARACGTPGRRGTRAGGAGERAAESRRPGAGDIGQRTAQGRGNTCRRNADPG